MSKAFVLVNTNLGSEGEIESELKKIEGIVGVYNVYGVYDLVVEVDAESPGETQGDCILKNPRAQECQVHAHTDHGVMKATH